MSPDNPGFTERLALRLADFVMRRAWLVIVATLLLVIVAGSGARFLEFSNNYRVFFSPENPELVAFERFQDTYTKNDNILFVIQPGDGQVFEPELAAALEWLTAEAWKIPYAIRVDSITNFQHSWADGDDLTVEDLVRAAASLDPTELERRRDVALAEPLLRGNLLSPDARTTGVNVTLQYPEQSLTEVPEAVGYARDLAHQLRQRHPGVKVALSGVSMLNNAFAEAGQRDAMTLMPGMFLVLVVFMFVVLRSVSGTAGTLLVIAFSAITALGLAGFAGITLDPIALTAPIIIMTLGIADSVHLLVTVLMQMRDGSEKRAAIRESLRVNFLAVVITSVTTVIGFLSLNFSDAPPFWYLGNITAVGIVAALLYSVVFLPAFFSVVPLTVRQRSRERTGASRALGAMADWVTVRYRPVLAIMATLTIVLVALVPTIDLNDEWVKYFDYRIPFRAEAEWGMENLNGIYLLEFSVEAEGPEGISDPEYLHHLERFTAWLRDQPEVTHVYSYTDVIKRLNKNMHADDPAWYRIPGERDLAAQYLLLYELSLPYGLDLTDRISIDKSATRVTATVGDRSTVEFRDVLRRAQNWLRVETPEFMWARPTGASVMFAYISQRNIESMLRGNLIAVLLIAGVIVLALRSLGIGALSLIPNAVPILVTFGVWALLVGQVGMAAATVSATSLGIVVDDTVHLLTKYLRARREKRYDRPAAIRYAFETVGIAIISTTVILAFGFGVLAFSAFRINAQMGLLTMLAIVLALATDLLLLPALLMVGHRATEKETKTMKEMKAMRKTFPLPLGNVTTVLLAALLLVASPPGSGVAVAQRAAGDKFAAATASPEELSPEKRGWVIAARSDRSDRGFTDSAVDLQMILRNAAGKQSIRTLSLRTLEVPDESVGDKSLIVFDRPADIDGTALLSHAKILKPDDQWLYLPALKRVKRISSVNKSGPFVGSEFAFEDFTGLELEKYDYKYLRSEPCGQFTCDVVERIPRYEHSGYTRQISWVDQEVFQVRKLEFYDRRGDLLKTLTLDDYRLYDDKFWRAHRLSMVNHQTGKKTDLIFSEYRFGNGLRDSNFGRGALRRIR
ncbi:MAG: outer membrane lipoprotein-sorting protein [Alphaproteobacteria bacterium]